jgi:LuxR family maltose regulon positive regulatory protein
MTPLILGMRARYYLSRGQVEEAYQLIHPPDVNGKPRTPSDIEQDIFISWLVIQRAYAKSQYDRKKINKTLSVLSERLAAQESAGENWYAIKLLILQALAYQIKDDMPSAMTTLDRALTLAEPEGFIRTFIDQGKPMKDLLLEAKKHKGQNIYINRLLDAFNLPVNAKETHQADLIDPLSSREIEVLRLIASGKSNNDIASEIFVAVSTVKSHVNHIFQKLDVKSRTQAIARSSELGIIEI